MSIISNGKLSDLSVSSIAKTQVIAEQRFSKISQLQMGAGSKLINVGDPDIAAAAAAANYTMKDQMDIVDVLYLLFFVSGIVFNVLAFFVAFIVFSNSAVVRTYVINMIAADVSLLCTGFYFKFKSFFQLLGSVACKVAYTSDITLLHVSCYTIMLIAFYRYSRLFSLSPSNSTLNNLLFSSERRLKMSVAIIWLVPLCIASPMMYFTEHIIPPEETPGEGEPAEGGRKGTCGSMMPYDVQTVYNIATFLTSYIIPGVCVTYLYSIIIIKTYFTVVSLRSASIPAAVAPTFLSCSTGGGGGATLTLSQQPPRPSQSHQPPSQAQPQHVDARTQVYMMRFLTFVVVAFWVLHLPFWVCNLCSTLGVQFCSKTSFRAAITLTYVNAALNPFLYSLLSTDCAKCSCSWLTNSCLCAPIKCMLYLCCPSCDEFDDSNSLSDDDSSYKIEAQAARRNVHGGAPLEVVNGKQNRVYGCQPIINGGGGGGGTGGANQRLTAVPTSQRTKEQVLASNRSQPILEEGPEVDQVQQPKLKDSKC